jgi:hypothetical protein
MPPGANHLIPSHSHSHALFFFRGFSHALLRDSQIKCVYVCVGERCKETYMHIATSFMNQEHLPFCNVKEGTLSAAYKYQYVSVWSRGEENDRPQ